MSDTEKLLNERVNRYYGPVNLMMWQGFLFLVTILLLVVGGVFGSISVQTAVMFGVFAFAIVAAHGTVMGSRMTRESMREEELKKMREEGLIGKAKRERLEINDGGTLVNMADYDPEDQSYAYS